VETSHHTLIYSNALICRDEGRPDHDRLLWHVRRVAGPSNGLKLGWRGAWVQRTPLRWPLPRVRCAVCRGRTIFPRG